MYFHSMVWAVGTGKYLMGAIYFPEKLVSVKGQQQSCYIESLFTVKIYVLGQIVQANSKDSDQTTPKETV